MAGNNTTTISPHFTKEPLAISAFYIVLSVLIIFENILGVIVIFANSKLHSTTNIFISSMAVTDVGTGLFSMLTQMFHFVDALEIAPSFDFGLPHNITAGCFYAFMMISIAHMALIAWERYIFISHPFFYKRRCNMRTIAIALTIFWVSSVAFAGLLFSIGLHEIVINTSGDMPVNEAYIAGTSLYLFSVVLTGMAYGLIAKLAWSRKRSKAIASHLPHQEESWKDVLKTIKFFLLVYGIFLLFTAPLFVSFVTHYFTGKVPILVLVTTSSLSVLDSGVNFLVLYILNEEFRCAMKKTVSNICRRH